MSSTPKTIISTALVTLGTIAATVFILNKRGLLTYEIEEVDPKASACPKSCKKQSDDNDEDED